MARRRARPRGAGAKLGEHGGHPVHVAGADHLHAAERVAVARDALEAVRHRLQPDVRVRRHVHARAPRRAAPRRRRAEVVGEHERPHAPELAPRQRAQHAAAADERRALGGQELRHRAVRPRAHASIIRSARALCLCDRRTRIDSTVPMAATIERIDLNKVAAFVRVVEAGSFTKAARSLGVPKSSVSRQVAQLEEALGVRLLQRTTRSLHPTEAGTAYFDRVSRALVGVEEASATIADLQASVRGVVRVTAPVDVGVWLLAEPVAAFTRKHPGVQVDLVLTGRVVNLVEEGIDLALRAGALSDSSLVARRLAPLEGGLFASAKYLARRGVPRRLEDLAKHDVIMFRPVNGRATLKMIGPDGDVSVDVTGPVGADDLSFVRQAMLAGLGIGLVPAFHCRGKEPGGKLRAVLPQYRMRSSPFHLVYPSARYLPQRVTLLRDHLLAALGGASGGDATPAKDVRRSRA
jgi:DNA-binding transcriptional LysR family regulator